MTKKRRFGYWTAIDDSESASEAVRMSGLPILIMGGAEGLHALIQSVPEYGDPRAMWVAIASATVLIVVAFRLRGGHAAWVPLVVLMFAMAAVTRLTQLVGGGAAASIPSQQLTGWIIPVLCALLMIGGLRGWLWMHAHGARRSF